MKLSQLVSQPSLQRIVIDSPAIVEKYGEEIEFWIYDRVDMDTFMRVAQLNDGEDFSGIMQMLVTLMRDETGEQLVQNASELPLDVLVEAANKVADSLGKTEA